MRGNGLRLAAMRAVFQLQQNSNLGERKADALRRFDKAHPRDIIRGIAPHPTKRTRRLVEQLFALIKTDGFDVDGRLAGLLLLRNSDEKNFSSSAGFRCDHCARLRRDTNDHIGSARHELRGLLHHRQKKLCSR